MGLHVGFAYDVKIHECETKKVTGETSYYVLIEEDDKPFGKCVGIGTLSSNSFEADGSKTPHPNQYLYKLVVEPVYSCECDEAGKRIQTIFNGYYSYFHESGGIKPGEMVEYTECDGFYYGGYNKWGREVENGQVGLFHRMSDCDGHYVGEFVEMLREELLSVDVANLTETQEEYLSMLTNVPDESIRRCLISHH